MSGERQTLPRGAAAAGGVGHEDEAWPLAWKTVEGALPLQNPQVF